MRILVGPAVVLLATAACSDQRATVGLASEARDSAGIRIVENVRPPDGTRLGWRVDSVPLLSIGALEGEDPYLLHQVRDAMRLSDGRIVVANRGSQELRVFAGSGVHLATWGGSGEGPGEFNSLVAVAGWQGDSVIAWYSQRERLSVFDRDGNFGRTMIPGDPGDGRDTPEEISADGTILVSRSGPGGGTLADGLRRGERLYEVANAEGVLTAPLEASPGSESYLSMSGNMMRMMTLPFFRSARTAVWAGRFVVAPNDSYEIRAFGPNGALDLVVRREHALVAPTPAHLDAYIERQAAARPPEEQAERRRSMREQLAEVPMPETFPAFDQIIADALGNLWIQEYDLPGQERPDPLWTVFDVEGRVLGFVETPSGLRIYEIGEDYILGRATDDLGVEYVQMWSLERTGG
ncbi:MAG: hypothetical protein F4205_01920 [Gemmatimonadetes bacterium]|nr:hypothetical protein [Gemmatimonadota bacterium]MXX70962.1 hypothetical protein [Gemmatimonadota bacterium]MYC89887.1 hypothetical protein [Gemmatimonadota bacterium]MYG34226.1 hypothetical protein [Gemmatimonadota bacterium]